jgi:hypothetical protein
MDLSLKHGKTLEKIFPRTFGLLSQLEIRQTQVGFLKNWTLDQLHFFPMWLKEQRMPLSWIQVADYEYLKHSLSLQENFPVQQPGWHWSSSTRILLFTEGAKALKLQPGIYVIWKNPAGVQERILTELELRLLEALQEDHIFDEKSSPEMKEILIEFEKLGIVEAPQFFNE